jgi:hypothetical protein
MQRGVLILRQSLAAASGDQDEEIQYLQGKKQIPHAEPVEARAARIQKFHACCCAFTGVDDTGVSVMSRAPSDEF